MNKFSTLKNLALFILLPLLMAGCMGGASEQTIHPDTEQVHSSKFAQSVVSAQADAATNSTIQKDYSVPAVSGASCLPPGWWGQAKKEDDDNLFFRGSAFECATEQQAYQQAYNSARQRIIDDISPRISTTIYGKNSRMEPVRGTNIVYGTSIVFEDQCQTQDGNWNKWVLVAFPRKLAEEAKKRAESEIAERLPQKTGQAKIPLLILPFAFEPASEEQFPEVVQKYRRLGYGNAIWQTLEDLIWESPQFEINTLPSTNDVIALTKLLDQRGNIAAKLKELEAPNYVLKCNVNFLSQPDGATFFGKSVERQKFSASINLRLFNASSEHRNAPVVIAKGDAKNEYLQTATDEAATNAVNDLLLKFKKLSENL